MDNLLDLLLAELPWVFMVVSLAGALLTLNALRPLRHPLVLFQSFLSAWWVAELALHHVVWQVMLVAIFVVLGGLSAWPGWIGLGVTLLSWVGLFLLYRRARSDVDLVRRALDARLAFPEEMPRYPLGHVVVPLLAFLRRDVTVRRGVEFCTVEGGRLRMDVFSPRRREGEPPQRRPAVIQIHGGAWVTGFKWLQGIPLLTHLAANGWVGFNVDYRLSPRATFPEHLIDIKRAVAWIREHADEYEVDPEFIVVTGGSAGAHLAALVALTPGDPEYQPGFEAADTSVAACVCFYGVYDLTNIRATKPEAFRLMVEKLVLKRRYADDPKAFERASPVAQIHADAPPFFVVHGAADTVVPVGEARHFVEELERVSATPAVYAEIPGAGHAFDIFPSLRTRLTTEAAERFLDGAYGKYLQARRAGSRGVPTSASDASPAPTPVAGP